MDEEIYTDENFYVDLARQTLSLSYSIYAGDTSLSDEKKSMFQFLENFIIEASSSSSSEDNRRSFRVAGDRNNDEDLAGSEIKTPASTSILSENGNKPSGETSSSAIITRENVRKPSERRFFDRRHWKRSNGKIQCLYCLAWLSEKKCVVKHVKTIHPDIFAQIATVYKKANK